MYNSDTAKAGTRLGVAGRVQLYDKGSMYKINKLIGFDFKS
jgi:hypothetical protein